MVAIHSFVDGNILSIAISHVIAHIAVPMFFLISGYLFYKGLEVWKWNKWIEKIGSRVKSLFIPYIIWICLYALFNQTIPSTIDFWCSQKWNIARLDFWGNPNLSTAPLLVPMWFIRDLLVVCILLTPLIYLLLHKESPRLVSQVSVVIITLLYFTQTSLQIPGLTSLSIFYFSLGAYLSLHHKNMESGMTGLVLRYSVYVFTMILLIVEIIFDGHNTLIGDYIYPFYVLGGVFSLIGIFQRVITSSSTVANKLIMFCETNASSCFFVFASHIFILPIIKQVLIKLISLSTPFVSISSILQSSILYFGTIVSTVFTCVLLYRVVINRLPIVSKLLCGK